MATAKKTGGRKKATTKKPAGKKATAKKSARKKPAGKKTTAKKSARKKPAGRKATMRKTAGKGKKAATKKAFATLETLPLFETPPPAEPAAPAPAAVSTAVPAEVTSAGTGARNRADDAARAHKTAKRSASKQREISISEFFAKNRHLLGFDSLPKALLTAVKEAVDNSLDACEEAAILPDIIVEIKETGENRYRLVIEDSGPGILKQQVPKIFGKLLYGSKFHVLKQSRGQQGIGISAAVMYAQLTTGKPVKVWTRTGTSQKAHVYELHIDKKTNSPVIVSDQVTDWDRAHGIRIEMEIAAAYKKGQRSVDAYLHQVAMANPHAEIVFRPPKGEETIHRRLTDSLPDEPKAIRPHPHGVELGVLLDMLNLTRLRNTKGFLEAEFSRISSRVAAEVLLAAGVPAKTSPRRVSLDQAGSIIKAFAAAKIMKPPTNCLSPIGEDLLLRSLEREADADFFTALTRPPAVYRGNPFQIEAALAYGGSGLPKDDEAMRLYRFANRAPLIYQQSACAITQSLIGTAWKSYGVSQARGALPAGPLLAMVHIASAWVPFTSESKEAIAHYPEIIKEIKLALQECGRRLARYIRKGMRAKEEAKKRSYIEQYIPHIGIALQEILGCSEREEQRIVDRLKMTLEKSRKN